MKTVIILSFCFMLSSAASNDSNGNMFPFGDIRNCPTYQPTDPTAPLLRMEVLPGLGFDNLRNIDMGLVSQRNYSLCKVTNDGRFLIPDDVVVVPLQKTQIETYATLFDHWDNYTSMDSFSINVGFSVFSLVSGKFGFGYQHVKQHQYNDLAKTARVQIRNSLYRIILQPDSLFNDRFKNRLLDIAANIQNNNTDYATYLSDLLVRDYGTHVVRTVEAGAIAAQIDSISSSYVSDFQSDRSSITAGASANFFGKFSIGVSTAFSNGQADDTAYIKNRNHSRVVTIGGPRFRPNMTLDDWEQGLLDNLVAIDRSGDPLHFFITTDTLPQLPTPTLRELIDSVYDSVQRYYRVNTHYGCMDPTSPNFDYRANINDNSCKAPNSSYAFGGVYQTCEVDPDMGYEDLCAKGAAQVNTLTGGYSCPPGYTSIELHSGTVTGISKKEVCDNVCHHCGLFGWGRCCRCLSAWVNVLSAATYQAYWCVAEGEVKANSGFMFGGVYTRKTINPVTSSMSCPSHFYPLHIGEDMEVCVSSEYDIAYESAVPFAGFQSCISGNPLATGSKNNATLSNSFKGCPKTYKKVLATVDEGCEINYCVKLRDQYSTDTPTLPPYRSQPSLKKNLTQSLVIQGPYGEIWVKDENGDWVEVNGQPVTGKQLLDYLAPESSVPYHSATTDPNTGGDGDGGSVAVPVVISIIGTLIVCTVIIAIVFGSYKLWKKKKQMSGLKLRGVCEDNYIRINEDDTGHHSSPQEQRDNV